jgi:hypothetical protein
MAFGRFFSSFFACVIFVVARGWQPEVDRPGKVSDPSKTADAVPAVEPSPGIPVQLSKKACRSALTHRSMRSEALSLKSGEMP